MGEYRDDLDAAHSRIAALEAEVRDLNEQKAKKKPKKQSPAERAAAASKQVDVAAAAVQQMEGHLNGSLVPARAQAGGWGTLGAFFALHGALAWAFTPRNDLGMLAFVFSWVVPLTMAFWVYRHGRVIADPSTPLVARAQFGPTLFYRSRGAAAAMLAALVLGDLAWVAVGVPAMVRSSQGPTPQRAT
jgi:hypothetical protein